MSSPELVFEGVTFVLSFLIIQFLGKKKREKKTLRQQKQLCRLWWKDTHSPYYYTIIKSILVLNKIKSCQEIPNTNLSRKKYTHSYYFIGQFSLSNLLQDLFYLDFCPALHFFLDRLYFIYTCYLLNGLVCSFFKSYIVQIILRQVTQLLILLYFYDLFVSFIFQ